MEAPVTPASVDTSVQQVPLMLWPTYSSHVNWLALPVHLLKSNPYDKSVRVDVPLVPTAVLPKDTGGDDEAAKEAERQQRQEDRRKAEQRRCDVIIAAIF